MSDDVSRETAPAPLAPPSTPETARGVFSSDRLPLAERYAELLATEGVVRGLIGPREAPRLWDRHLLNSRGPGGGDPGWRHGLRHRHGCRAAGAGAGDRPSRPDDHAGGAPAAPYDVPRRGGRRAGSRATSRSCAVGPRRCTGPGTFDVVTSRAVAPLERLLGWSMPLVAPTGALVAMKGRIRRRRDRRRPDFLPHVALRRFRRCSRWVREWLDPPTTVVRVAWADPARVGWPLAPTARRRTTRRGRHGGESKGA